MVQNVIQERPPGRSVFEFKYLREFVNSATALGMPDDTEVVCNTAYWSGAVTSLRTIVRNDVTETSTAPAASVGMGTSAVAEDSEKRTIVSQDSTGPRVQWSRWGRTFSAPTLTLGDVRMLIARVDELGLPAEKYVVRGVRVAWSYGQHVYSISAGPLV